MRLMNKIVSIEQLSYWRMIWFKAKDNLASVILTHSLQTSLFIAQCLRAADFILLLYLPMHKFLYLELASVVKKL